MWRSTSLKTYQLGGVYIYISSIRLMEDNMKYYGMEVVGNIMLYTRDVRAHKRRFRINLSLSINFLMMWYG